MTARKFFRGHIVAAVATAALVVSACGASDEVVSDDVAEAEAEAVSEAEAEAEAEAKAAIEAEFGSVAVAGEPLAPFESSIEDLTIGTQSPVVTGEGFDGSPIIIGAATENPTLVVFLAHWCPHCNDELPVLIELGASGQLPDGLDVVGVSTAADAERDNFPPSEWIGNSDWTWLTMADDKELTAIAALGGTSFPFAVVLDVDGTVLARRAGGASADETIAFLNDALASATA